MCKIKEWFKPKVAEVIEGKSKVKDSDGFYNVEDYYSPNMPVLDPEIIYEAAKKYVADDWGNVSIVFNTCAAHLTIG